MRSIQNKTENRHTSIWTNRKWENSFWKILKFHFYILHDWQTVKCCFSLYFYHLFDTIFFFCFILWADFLVLYHFLLYLIIVSFHQLKTMLNFIYMFSCGAYHFFKKSIKQKHSKSFAFGNLFSSLFFVVLKKKKEYHQMPLWFQKKKKNYLIFINQFSSLFSVNLHEPFIVSLLCAYKLFFSFVFVIQKYTWKDHSTLSCMTK